MLRKIKILLLIIVPILFLLAAYRCGECAGKTQAYLEYGGNNFFRDIFWYKNSARLYQYAINVLQGKKNIDDFDHEYLWKYNRYSDTELLIIEKNKPLLYCEINWFHDLHRRIKDALAHNNQDEKARLIIELNGLLNQCSILINEHKDYPQ